MLFFYLDSFSLHNYHIKYSLIVFGNKLHLDDDTSSSIDSQLLPLFIRQHEETLAKFPRLRYIPQWTSWADSKLEAVEVDYLLLYSMCTYHRML